MEEAQSKLNEATARITHYRRLYQTYVDRTVPHKVHRWAGLGCLLAVFLLRIVIAQGWYIVCYSLGIYLLNLFLAFLTPKFDPSLEQDQRDQDMEEGTATSAGEGLTSTGESEDEFRPFIRRLPEFKFWYNATRATAIAFVCSWFKFLDIPVVWQILLMYFVVLFSLTMRRQIQHMIKYRYLPFDLGKMKYGRN